MKFHLKKLFSPSTLAATAAAAMLAHSVTRVWADVHCIEVSTSQIGAGCPPGAVRCLIGGYMYCCNQTYSFCAGTGHEGYPPTGICCDFQL